jgi:hypothetical protein
MTQVNDKSGKRHARGGKMSRYSGVPLSPCPAFPFSLKQLLQISQFDDRLRLQVRDVNILCLAGKGKRSLRMSYETDN